MWSERDRETGMFCGKVITGDIEGCSPGETQAAIERRERTDLET